MRRLTAEAPPPAMQELETQLELFHFSFQQRIMGVKLVPYSLFLIRKGIRNEKYVSFLFTYLIRNKE